MKRLTVFLDASVDPSGRMAITCSRQRLPAKLRRIYWKKDQVTLRRQVVDSCKRLTQTCFCAFSERGLAMVHSLHASRSLRG